MPVTVRTQGGQVSPVHLLSQVKLNLGTFLNERASG